MNMISVENQLDHHTNDSEYLAILKDQLLKLIDSLKPYFIFFQSGVDILSNDKLGMLSITKECCDERDRIVLEIASKHGIPLTASMGDGYADNLDDIVDAHCDTYRIARDIFK